MKNLYFYAIEMSIKDRTLVNFSSQSIVPLNGGIESFTKYFEPFLSFFLRMRRLILATTVATVAFIYFELDLVHAEEKSCKQVMGDLTKRQLGGIAACGKSLKFKNGKDKSKKMNCILKCVMTNEKVLNEQGYFDSAQLDALILKEFPPFLREKANASFFPCAEKGAGIDPNPETDEFCKSYDPFIKCLLGNLPTLCNEK